MYKPKRYLKVVVENSERRLGDLTDHPTYDYIIEQRYQVRTTQAYLMSQEEIERMGVPAGHGFNRRDPFNHAPTIAVISILEMVVMFAEGSPFVLVDSGQMLEIENVIYYHLKNWDDYMATRPPLLKEGADSIMLYRLDNYRQHIRYHIKLTARRSIAPATGIPLMTSATSDTPNTPVMDHSPPPQDGMLEQVLDRQSSWIFHSYR